MYNLLHCYFPVEGGPGPQLSEGTGAQDYHHYALSLVLASVLVVV